MNTLMRDHDIPALELVNAQNYFDRVCQGIISQGCWPSLSLIPSDYDDDGGCAYRGEHGRRCAAGWLIPDEAYTPEIENERAGCLMEDHPGLFGFTADSTPARRSMASFLDVMQNIHDQLLSYKIGDALYRHSGLSVQAWSNAMAKLAQQCGLDDQEATNGLTPEMLDRPTYMIDLRNHTEEVAS